MEAVVTPTFDIEAAFRRRLKEEVEERVEATGVPTREWLRAGKATKTYPNKEDGTWWADNGPTIARSWVKWRDGCLWKLWVTPDGVPAIELPYDVQLGSWRIKGYIDRVFQDENGDLVVVDLKTGARDPGESYQMWFYAAAVELQYGVRPKRGAYWMGRKGGLVEIRDLDRVTTQVLSNILEEFKRAKDSGIYLPNISGKCYSCGVAIACAAMGGPEARKYDPLHPEYEAKAHE